MSGFSGDHIYIGDQWWLHMYVHVDQRWPRIYVDNELWSCIYVGDQRELHMYISD